jgi:hypothetical protein
MKKVLLILIVLTSAFKFSYSQMQPSHLWSFKIGAGNIETVNSMTSDLDGNVYIAGYFGSSVDFDFGVGDAVLTSVGSNDVFVAKYDNDGNYLWAISMGSFNADRALSVTVDDDGNVLVAGYIAGDADFDPSASTATLIGQGAEDIFLAKYDEDGNYLWAKCIGNAYSEAANSIATDSNGDVYITGYFRANVDFNPGPAVNNLSSASFFINAIFLAKFSAIGDYVWAISMGSTTVNSNGRSVVVDDTDHIYVSGGYGGSNVDFDPGAGTTLLTSVSSAEFFLAKYDTDASLIWAKTSAGANGGGFGLAVGSDNAIYATGVFNGTSYMNPGPDPDPGELIGNGQTDVFIGKWNSAGDFQWAKSFGDTQIDQAHGIALDPDDNVVVTGRFYGTVDFDPAAATNDVMAYSGTDDIYLASYDSDGDFRWARGFGGMGNEAGHAVTVDPSGNVFMAGVFQFDVSFDPNNSAATITASVLDGFIAKYEEVAGPPPPVAPTTLDASLILSPLSVSLTWTDNSINEDGFIVERESFGGGFSQIASLPANSVGYTDNTVLEATGYTYRVYAYNTIGNSLYSNEEDVLTPTTPLAPTTLNADLITSPLAVELTWTDNSLIENGFKVEREIVGMGYTEIADLPANSTTFTDNSVSVNTTYNYRVYAYNLDGNSTNSNVDQVVIINLSSEELEAFVWDVYPNPANEILTVQVENQDARVRIYDATGKLVIETIVFEDKTIVDISSFENGIYFVEIFNNEIIQTKRVLVSK